MRSVRRLDRHRRARPVEQGPAAPITEEAGQHDSGRHHRQRRADLNAEAAPGPRRDQRPEREPQLCDRRVQRRNPRSVDQGRLVGREQLRVAEAGQRRVQRHVVVGIDAGQLDPPVPDIAVGVVAGHRVAEQPGQLDRGRDDHDHDQRHPPGIAPARERDRGEDHRRDQQEPAEGAEGHEDDHQRVADDHHSGPDPQPAGHRRDRNDTKHRPPPDHSSSTVRPWPAATSARVRLPIRAQGRGRDAACPLRKITFRTSCRSGIGIHLAEHQAAGNDQGATPAEQGGHVAADPDVAVHQQRSPPPAFGGQPLASDRRSAGPPPARLIATATEEMSTPSAA